MLKTTDDNRKFKDGLYDLVCIFPNNSRFESYERGYKEFYFFEDGKGNIINTPSFIFNNSFSIIGYQITKNDNLHLLSDEVDEIIRNSEYNYIDSIIHIDDNWYIGYNKTI